MMIKIKIKNLIPKILIIHKMLQIIPQIKKQMNQESNKKLSPINL